MRPRAAACCPTARSRSATSSGPTSTPFRQPTGRRSAAAWRRIPSGSSRSSTSFAQGRLDYQRGAAHQFFARYTYDDAEQRLPTDYPAFPRSFISTNQFLTAEYRHVRSDRTLETARFGYSRTRIGQNVEANLTPSLPPLSPAANSSATSTSAACSGSVRRARRTCVSRRTSTAASTTSPTRAARHLFKAGALVERYRDFMTNPTFSLGHLHVRERARVPREPRDPVRRADARGGHRSRLAVDAVRRLRAGQLLDLPAPHAQRRPALRVRRRCRSTPAGATRRWST